MQIGNSIVPKLSNDTIFNDQDFKVTLLFDAGSKKRYEVETYIRPTRGCYFE